MAPPDINMAENNSTNIDTATNDNIISIEHNSQVSSNIELHKQTNGMPLRDSDSGHGLTSSSSASDSSEDLCQKELTSSLSETKIQDENDDGEISDNFVDAIDNLNDYERQEETISDENNSSLIQDDDGTKLKKQLKEVNVILKMALSNEFAKALQLCEERTNELYFSLAHSTLCFLRCALTLEQSDLQAALDSINQSFEISSKKKRKTSTASMMIHFLYKPNYNHYTDEEIHAELINAESLLLTALISFLADQSILCFVKGAFRIRSCYQRYKECIYILENKTNWSSLEAKQHFESGVRMGHGIFNLLMSYLPRRILRLLEYVGFSGNRTLGVDELDVSINLNDGLRSVFSCLVILTYHTYIENLFGLGMYDLNKVEQLLNELSLDFPNSAFYYLFKGRYNQMKGNLRDTIESYQLCINAQDDWKQFHSICHWEMIWCYCVELNWPMAIHYSDLLRRQSRWSPAGYTYLYGTFLYAKLIEDKRNGLFEGNNSQLYKDKMNEIISIMKSVPKLRIRYAGKTIPAEKFAITRATKFLEQNNELTLPALEFLYIWNMFAVFKNNTKQLEGILSLINSEIKYLNLNYSTEKYEHNNDINYFDNLSLCLLLRAMCLKHLNREAEAEKDLKQIIDNEKNIKTDTFLVPHSIMELAILEMSKKEYDSAKAYIKSARDEHTGYLLESIVHFRLHSTSRAIRIEQQELDLFNNSYNSSLTSNNYNN